MLIAAISWWWCLLIPVAIVALLIIYNIVVANRPESAPSIDKSIPETAAACAQKADGMFKQAQMQSSSAAKHYYRAALALAEAGLTKDAGHLESRLARTIAHYKLDQFADAVADWESCVERNFQVGKSLLHLGNCYRKTNELQRAIDTFTRLLEAETNNDRREGALLNRAMIYCDAGRFEEAEQDLRRLSPNDPQVVYHAALCRFRGDKTKAMEEVDKKDW